MTQRRSTPWKALCLGLLLGSSALVHAATTSTNFDATATVTSSCAISAGNLAFGSFAAVDNANVDATGSVTVTCSIASLYEVALDEGIFSELGTVLTRRMSDGGSNHLSYQMYSDVARLDVWGKTSLVDVVAGVGSGSDQVLTVYGRIPSGQTTAVTGNYTDTVTVTVTF